MTDHHESSDEHPFEPSTYEWVGGVCHATDSDRVWQGGAGGGWLIINEDGSWCKYIDEAKEKIRAGQATLWRRIAPLHFGDVELKRNTQLWDTEREAWLIADTPKISKDGMPRVQFLVKESSPPVHVTLTGEQIEDRLEEGTLESKETVNDRAEGLLEEMRADSEVDV